MTTRLAMQACLACGHKMDMHAQMAASDEPDAVPEPGDFTLCIRCGHIMAFDDEMRFRRLTHAEIYEVAQDTRIQAAVAAIGQLPWMPPRQ